MSTTVTYFSEILTVIISALIYLIIHHINNIIYIDHILRQIWCERVRTYEKKWIEGSEFGTNAICHNIWEREKKRDVPKLTSYEYRIDSAECKTLKSTKNRLKTEKLILSDFVRTFPFRILAKTEYWKLVKEIWEWKNRGRNN